MAKEGKGKKRGERLIKFFKGVWFELKKVSWPTRKELTQHTVVVITSVALVSFIVWLMDLGLGRMLELILR